MSNCACKGISKWLQFSSKWSGTLFVECFIHNDGFLLYFSIVCEILTIKMYNGQIDFNIEKHKKLPEFVFQKIKSQLIFVTFCIGQSIKSSVNVLLMSCINDKLQKQQKHQRVLLLSITD